jgi:hypothetical protein
VISDKEKSFYSQITLTPEEVEEALHEARKRKYFKEKHRDYWNGKENDKETTIQRDNE